MMKTTARILLKGFVFTLSILMKTTSVQAQTTAEEYRSLWNTAKEAYDNAIGYRSEEIPLVKSQLSSNASDVQEGQDLGYILDGNPYTFWHSDWHNHVSETHYLQVSLEEPIGNDIAIYMKRRFIEQHHLTRLGCHCSNDGTNWTEIGEFHLDNAYYGAEVMSNPLSLGDNTYRYIRLYFLENSDGLKFGHIAEFRLLQVEILGEATNRLLLPLVNSLYAELMKGKDIADKDITEDLLYALQTAYDNLQKEKERVSAGLLPSFMVQKSDLPTLFLNTTDGLPVAGKAEWKYADMWRLEGDSVAAYDSLKIKGRGNSTWGMAKKPYRIKFGKKEKFLGKRFAKAKNWTLIANYADKTLLRNAVAAFIGKELGQPFVPAAEFVDLVLNGEYLGNYQVSDQIEVHKKRVEITEQEEIPTDSSDITGGYLIEFDGSAQSEPVYFYTSHGQPVTIKSPDDDVIVDAQKDYIRCFVNEFEERLFSDNYRDSTQGYRSMVDSTTLASWFVANEYTGNADGYWSTYAYKEAGDDRLYWGPMWDYDIAFNNCDRIGEVTDRLMMDAGFTSGKMTEYVRRMWDDPWFRNLTGRLWHKAVLQEGLVEKTIAYIDSMAQVIDQSQRLNFGKWSLSEHVYNEIVLYSTYQEGVDYLKKFVREHAEFLSATFPNPEGLPSPPPAPNNPLGVEKEALYYVYNVQTGNVTDMRQDSETATICTWAGTPSRAETQLWQFVPISGDHYIIVLQGSNLAITDVAVHNGTSYNTGSTIALCERNDSDKRQWWEFVPTADYYAIANAQTGLAWNNSGGNADNGNPIITWTNDANNSVKPTRQWYIQKASEDMTDDIASASGDEEYRVGYDPVTGHIVLHTKADASKVSSMIAVYDTNGCIVGRGDAETPVSVAQLPDGIYIISWNVGGTRRSIKFNKTHY